MRNGGNRIIDSDDETRKERVEGVRLQKGRLLSDQRVWKKPAFWILAGILLALVTAIAGADSWKSTQKTNEIVIEGAMLLSEDDLLRAAAIESGAFLDEVDIAKVQRRLAADPYIRRVDVNKIYPGRIRITIDERVPVAGFLNMGQVMYLDADGVVLPRLGTVQTDLPLVTGIPGVKVSKAGSPIGAREYFDAVAILDAALATDSSAYTQISEVHLDRESETSLFWGDGAVMVKFGSGDEQRKMQRLWAFWQQFGGDDAGRELEYLDVRFNDQVVAKWKGDARRINEKL